MGGARSRTGFATPALATGAQLGMILGSPREIEIVGSSTVTGNCVVFTAVNPTIEPDLVTQLQFTASLSTPSLLITYEGLMFSNLPHNALGEALLEVSSGSLVVSNIGSSGQDGVGVEMTPASRWDVAWNPLDPGGILPESASVAITGIGQVGGAANHPIGTTTVRKLGSLYQLSADFSPIGATSLKVLVYNDNAFVDSVTGITATQFATADGCLLDDHWGNPVGWPPIGGSSLTFLDPRTFDFGFKDAKVLIGDELWILPEDAALAVDFLTRVEIRAARIPSITITQESVQANYLCGDADGNGAISIADVVYLINYIFAGGPAPNPLAAGDADCSGAISIADAVYLINYIFAGGAAPCAACP